MDYLVDEFSQAHKTGNGYQVAQVFLPIPPLGKPDRLRKVVRSSNHATIKKDTNKAIRKSPYLSDMAHDELAGWTEILVAYWKALNELVPLLDPSQKTNRVRKYEVTRQPTQSLLWLTGQKTPCWTQVYELWKDFTSQIIRGYTNYGFQAWSIPCLYVAGKHLRLYAIKSDEERAQTPVQEKGTSFADDFSPETETHGQLRDCEQQLKRIFTLCLTDRFVSLANHDIHGGRQGRAWLTYANRAPIEESRKWGIYFVINLLFKTYFRLKSPSLSRTILKAINAYQGDMPSIRAFPKSQRVTFQYYAGVLAFLEENYVEVRQRRLL